MRRFVLPVLFFLFTISPLFSQDHIDGFPVISDSIPVPILLEECADEGVKIAVENLRSDFGKVTDGHLPDLLSDFVGKRNKVQKGADLKKQNRLIIVATLNHSPLLDKLAASGKFDASQLSGAREKYIITTISSPSKHISEALVIAGSDKRGTIYGVYELSKMIGVSPWYYWADVPIAIRSDISIPRTTLTAGEPTVRYRGIFLNDEAPALTGWVNENFGGYNSKFYVKVFELILRLKGNFLWPAMWDAAFYDDDPLNSTLADTYGIIMGTSHHEPLARAQKEWKRYGKGPWNYEENKAVLDSFWRAGVARMKNTEDILTIGMRGDGDMPMSEQSNISLLENIVSNQRRIIAEEIQLSSAETSGTAERTPLSPDEITHLASKVPQVWALYKEVQDYYDKGMKVPDDVTLLFSDDNWGNVRKLPEIGSPKRSGGYGMYYHVDYVGGPRNYKWLNVSQIQRMWEQLNLCYEFGVTQLWILNVGDLKPMEYPIQFFLDMAWSPATYYPSGLTPPAALGTSQTATTSSSASSVPQTTMSATADNRLLSPTTVLTHDRLFQHTVDFCASIFGPEYATECARLIDVYSKYSRRTTPELMNEKTYSLTNYDEFRRVTSDFVALREDALRLFRQLPQQYHAAYEQLVLFPIQAFSNLYEMYYAVAMNHSLYEAKDTTCNHWADQVKFHYQTDSLLCWHYNHELAEGKWNHMMDQTHIGYRYWQQPPTNTMPTVFHFPPTASDTLSANQIPFGNFPGNATAGGFRRMPVISFTSATSTNSPEMLSSIDSLYRSSGRSITPSYITKEAREYSRAVGNENVNWVEVPDLGRTGSAMILLPAYTVIDTTRTDETYLEYTFSTTSDLPADFTFPVTLYFSPTLNFNSNRGLRYAISLDGSPEQIVNINGTYSNREMEQWQAQSIIRSSTKHTLKSVSEAGAPTPVSTPHTLRIRFLQTGLVLQKLTIDFGGLQPSYLGPPQSKN